MTLNSNPSIGKRAISVLAALLFFACVLPANAQGVATVPVSQCVYQIDDDPAWAAVSVDDSNWLPLSQWRPSQFPSRFWVRCHVDLSSLRSTPDPAIQISLYSPYELYLNGARLATVGSLSTGNFSLNVVRSFPVPSAQITNSPALVALRILDRSSLGLIVTPMSRFIGTTVVIRTGAATQLDIIRRATIYSLQSIDVVPALCYGVIGVLALPMLALYLFDRKRVQLLLLGLAALCLADLRINEFLTASLLPYPYVFSAILMVLGNFGYTFTEFPFVYVLSGRRIPLLLWIGLIAAAASSLPTYAVALMGAYVPHWLVLIQPKVSTFQLLLHCVISFAPFHAFWPYRSIAPRMRPIAILCMILGLIDFVWFAVETTALNLPGIPNYFAHWGLPLLNARGIATACVLFTLLGLLFREQRQITQDRAFLAGEIQAATEIQRVLAPSDLDCAPGFRVQVAFHPMREIGGDFYLCRVLPDGRQRILIGDVSGKGASAAMTAALLLGGAAGRDADSPSELLAHLNHVLVESRVSGFATCLCADFAPGGHANLANAGHLAPYLRGDEVAIPGGMPLGLNPDGGYAEIAFNLSANDTLTFLSDGVVEARNPKGHLFGFDRARSVSAQTADQIARVAQDFGQEDDITVLTLSRLALQDPPDTAASLAQADPDLNLSRIAGA